MSYLQRVMRPDETVRHWGQLHWVIYVPGISLVASGAIATTAALAGVSGPLFPIIGFIGLLIGPVALAGAWYKRATTEIVVTDRRILLKTGWLARRTVEMNMDKVESVDVAQSLLGRMMDFGTVLVRGTGAGMEPLSKIAAPLNLRNSITVR